LEVVVAKKQQVTEVPAKHIPKLTKQCPECALLNKLGNKPHVPVKQRSPAPVEKEEEDGKEESE
jgi:hypothetical protein